VGVLAQATPDEDMPVGSYGWDGVGTRRLWIAPALRSVVIMLMPGMGIAAEPVHKAIEAAIVRALGDKQS
jgi:CubicO group peptidase (beta-lactamase class C family)